MGSGPQYTSCSPKVESPEPVTDEIIHHVASLARLRIDDDDLPELRRQLQEIIAMVSCLPVLEAGVAVPEPEMELRADVPRAGLDQAVALGLAAQTSGALIAVPAVLSSEDQA